MKHRAIIIVILLFANIFPRVLSAQEQAGEEQAGQERRIAEFPEENRNVIFVEGEDAVSTNFAVEPTLYYGASKSRTLQLNRSESMEGGTPFFAEYVMYVEEGGAFRFLYGGTPAGPWEDISTSYFSPFLLTIDDREPRFIYREDMKVRGLYIPSYYWCDLGTIELQKGIHRIKIEVEEKRKYDGKYYFYLDNLIFVREDALSDPGTPLPEVFPPESAGEKSLEFDTIPTYEQRIVDDPQTIENYEQTALLYTVVGDYANALRILQRAQLVDPENIELQVLEAKNRIWKGETTQGLSIYKELLQRAPERKEIWAEAGKVAAWTGNYQESIFFYTRGLEQFPDDLGLTVNLGMTHLWKGDVGEAEEYFETAYSLVTRNPEQMEELASIFRINGYPQKAVDVYKRGIEQFPDYIDFYLELQSLYSIINRQEEAEGILEEITGTFVMTDRLQQYIDTFRLKTSLRETIIDTYVEQVKASPNDLEIRELLVQTYLWNNRRDRAIDQYVDILSTYAYRHFRQLYDEGPGIMELLDTVHLYFTYFTRFTSDYQDIQSKTNSLYKEYEYATRGLKEYIEKKEAGEDLKDVEEAPSPEERLEKAEAELTAFLKTQRQVLETLERGRFRYEEIREALGQAVDQGAQEKDTFEKATEEVEWEWERAFFIDELESTYKNEPVLAGHVMGKIFQIESKLETSEMFLRRVSEEEHVQPPSIVALAETLLWRGKWEDFKELRDEREDLLKSYMPYYGEIMDTLASFETDAGEQYLSIQAGSLAEDVRNLKDSLIAQKEKTDALLETLRRDLDTLHTLLYEKMKRQFYYLEVDTHPIRYRLGRYYLEEGAVLKANGQFEKVLDVDPWNIDAKFNLALVRQRYGDWSEAMDKYHEVYREDPFYPNVAASYNQLARQHPDTFSVNTQLTGDTQEVHFSGNMSFLNNVSTLFSWKACYETEGIRLFKTYDGEEDGSYQTHRFSLGIPVNLFFLHTTLTPVAGVTLYSELFDDNIAAVFPDPDGSLPMGEFVEYWKARPVVAADLEFASGFFRAMGSYAYQTVEDTFYPGRESLYEHNAELSLNYALEGARIPFLKYSSVRGYGNMRVVEDGNILGSVSQEGSLGFHLADSPWLNLNVLESVSFDHSETPSSEDDNGYYAPDSALTVKGGLYVSSWFSLKNENSLGTSLTVTGGGYWDKMLADDPENPAFKLDVAGRIDFNKNRNNYYLGLSGSQNWDTKTGDAEYWSLTLNLGMEGRVLKLLAP